MALQIYNTLTNSKELFKPITQGEVKMYLCGPTVYDFLHIGNFRGPIFFNLARNYLEKSGYKVKFVYNYTDVDDKIIKRANEEGVDSREISERFIKEFETDFKNLGLRPHDVNPKVTDFMPQIVKYVEKLISNGKAYVIDGEVFYSIDSFKDYGKLSKKKIDELEAGQRVEVDKRKKNPMDFVLWKPSKVNEPSWDSPWGKGRPGWHIECSAMIKDTLGETIDIHAGGIDLIFPHHENEIAQGEGCNCKTYCHYWMHNNFINLRDEKMSKSLGNVMTARAFMKDYHPEILKYLFLSVHYRSMLSLTDEKILQTISALTRVYSAIDLAEKTVSQVSQEAESDKAFETKLRELDKKITEALDDDFNTAEFVSLVFEGVRSFNALGFATKKKTALSKGQSEVFLKWVKEYGKMSALFYSDATTILTELEDLLIKLKNIDLTKVEELMNQRKLARENKDWAKADEIRDELNQIGIELSDGSDKGFRVKISD